MNDQRRFFRCIAVLRAVAAMLVVWDHLVGAWLDKRHEGWLPLTLMRRYVTDPLGIIQDFGFFAVALFFLISGFIITHVAQVEDRRTFAVKRLFRVYPPFILSVAVIFVLNILYAHISGNTTSISQFSRFDVFWAMTLVNYVRPIQNPINGVAWTLVIEVLFYAMCFILLPLLQRHPRVMLLIMMAAVTLVVAICRDHGTSFFLFAASFSYLPFLVGGQIIYYIWRGRLRLWEGAAFFAANYLVVIRGLQSIQPRFAKPDNAYGVSYLYAVGVFLGLLWLERRLRLPQPLALAADMSYSIYLYHDGVGLLLMTALAPYLPFPALLLVALAAVGLLSYSAWRWVEVPSQRLARQLLWLRHGRTPATPLPVAPAIPPRGERADGA